MKFHTVIAGFQLALRAGIGAGLSFALAQLLGLQYRGTSSEFDPAPGQTGASRAIRLQKAGYQCRAAHPMGADLVRLPASVRLGSEVSSLQRDLVIVPAPIRSLRQLHFF